jgi:hypothetical protein
MNISDLDDALSNALNAISTAQTELRKSAAESEGLDIIRKSVSLDPAARALAALADAERRTAAIEAAHAPQSNAAAERLRLHREVELVARANAEREARR